MLQALYCTGAMPAGVYGSAANVGNRLTMAQLLADTVNGDDDLRRYVLVPAVSTLKSSALALSATRY